MPSTLTEYSGSVSDITDVRLESNVIKNPFQQVLKPGVPPDPTVHQVWPSLSYKRRAKLDSKRKDSDSRCAPKFPFDFYIPRGHAAWTDYLLQLIKSKICIYYMKDSEIKSIIEQYRANLRVRPNDRDPNLPEGYDWTAEQVAEWLGSEGYPQYKEAFLLNNITGRKLIGVDANALTKMGIRNVDHVFEITAKIRQLLGVPRPNMMRALARVVPFELYLRKRMASGRKIDTLTFQEFCKQQGFPHDLLLLYGKSSEIPCTCPVNVDPNAAATGAENLDEVESGYSLTSAPTVEFVVRHAAVHNQIVQEIIEELLSCVLGEGGTCNATQLSKRISVLLDKGYKSLSISSDPCDNSRERLQFATEVANGLVAEMKRCAEVLQDIEATQCMLQREITPQELQDMRLAATVFIEQVMPLASLLSAGGFSLESIFRQEPEFNDLVERIYDTAMRGLKGEFSDSAGESHDDVEEKALEVHFTKMVDVNCGAHLRQRGNPPCPCTGIDGRQIPCPHWPPRERDRKPPVKVCVKYLDEGLEAGVGTGEKAGVALVPVPSRERQQGPGLGWVIVDEGGKLQQDTCLGSPKGPPSPKKASNGFEKGRPVGQETQSQKAEVIEKKAEDAASILVDDELTEAETASTEDSNELDVEDELKILDHTPRNAGRFFNDREIDSEVSAAENEDDPQKGKLSPVPRVTSQGFDVSQVTDT